jgi:hypothetical protein
VLRRAGKNDVEVFTTRWAMSYLRGPMTRDQIAQLMADHRGTSAAATPTNRTDTDTDPDTAGDATSAAAAPGPELADDETTVMPEVAAGVPVRFVDVAAPWLDAVGGSAAGARREAAIVARVRLRYDETKADLVHDTEYECVLAPVGETVDVGRAVAVDYDDRDLRTDAPDGAVYRIVDAPLRTKTFFSTIERDLRDHLVRSLTLELPVNAGLKLYGRPGETAEAFALRCAQAADDRADADAAALRDKYEARVAKLRDSIAAAEGRVEVLEAEAESKRNSELLSTAGSILGGLLGGRKRDVLGKLGGAARRRGSTNAARERVAAAEGKVTRLAEQVEELELELADELAEIDERWAAVASDVSTTEISLERTDVQVAELCVAWLPVD